MKAQKNPSVSLRLWSCKKYLMKDWLQLRANLPAPTFPACHLRPALGWRCWQSGLRRMKLHPGNDAEWKMDRITSKQNEHHEKGWKRGHTQNYTNTYLQGTSRNIKEPKQGKKVDPNVGRSVRWNQHLCAAYLLGHPVFSVFGGLRFVFVQGLHVIHALFTWGSSYVTRCYVMRQVNSNYNVFPACLHARMYAMRSMTCDVMSWSNNVM